MSTLTAPTGATAALATPISEVLFEVSPRILQDAIKEATSGMKIPDNILAFIVTSDDPNDPLFVEHAIAPEPGNGRLIIGAMGNGMNHTFVDVPLESVSDPGIFLVPDAGRLRDYASATSDVITISHTYVEEPVVTLHRQTAAVATPNCVELSIQLFYEPEHIADQMFRALNHRFESPATVLEKDGLAVMLKRATKLATSLGSKAENRHGDLMWSDAGVEFATAVQDVGDIMTNQKMRFASADENTDDTPYFHWGIDSEQLSALESAASLTIPVYYGFVDADPDTGANPLMQIAYDQEQNDVDTYVQRQFEVLERQDNLKQMWTAGQPDSALFSHPNCHLFASVSAKSFFDAITRMQVRDSAAVLQIERSATESGHALLEFQHGGGANSVESIAAIHGNSGIQSMLLNSAAIKAINLIVDRAHSLQIVTYPVTKPDVIAKIGPEQPRAMMVIPVPLGEDGTQKITDPDRYLLTTWSL